MDELRRYRVLPGPEPDTLRFLDRETYEPSVVSIGEDEGHTASEFDGHAVGESVGDAAGKSEGDAAGESEGDAAGGSENDAARGSEGDAADGALHPGYLVDADLDWGTATPTVRTATVVRPTLYAFADRVDPMFEAARETWEAAQADGDGMNVRVTRDTDNNPNAVVYVFAESGDRGRFEEFREGARPIEPLVDRLNDRQGATPREVFVLRPPAGNYTVVAIALRKGGQLADTMRDTYERPRPDELLV